MDGRLQNDRQEIIDLWGDLPPEARLYLLTKCTQRRLHIMSRLQKALVMTIVFIIGGLAILATALSGHDVIWPTALLVGILIGMTYVAIARL